MKVLKEVIATYIEEDGKIKVIDTPFIRCGECKYFHENGWYNICDRYIGHGFDKDGYCERAKRRTYERITE